MLSCSFTQHLPALLKVTTVSFEYAKVVGGAILVRREGLGSSKTWCNKTRFEAKLRRPGSRSKEALSWSNGHFEARSGRSLRESSIEITKRGRIEIVLSAALNAIGRQNLGASAWPASVTQLNESKALLRLSTSN
mmetsp:Transcript_51481/g.111795  ORF Transcript_51481/g.111795 Transcript_51481/m.111795 type:complete len:135 (-) Transcript_51481:1538-1942(-)